MREPLELDPRLDLFGAGQGAVVYRMSVDGVCLDCQVIGDYEPLFWSSPPIGKTLSELLIPEFAERQHRMIREAITTNKIKADEFEVQVEGRFWVRGARAIRISDEEAFLVVRDFSPERLGRLKRELARAEGEEEAPAERITAENNPYKLSVRELQVLRLVGEGLGDKEIALRLGISIFTVNKHVGHVMDKMQATSRTEAAVRAAREGIIA
jgi:DNA-binding CsgD family transcriptional regulator